MDDRIGPIVEEYDKMLEGIKKRRKEQQESKKKTNVI